ncbi:MAG: transporter substrate-binding domain-containing protein [Nitrospinaceae bacterium]|nr:basic amino acid ABC transporter substrate-binding protein [Nitrospinaceae bacterium]NIT83754.1 basic amino acid ABC transporter substrate-binding protein [Nitrospinaceae bacterium]NIW07524.1 transporter substrate-binding domain-containing protein [Nitrospinaceae bacterium]NIX36112.1 transporter substrate-binding domain-containing protein [Nitrospinaceae bacterium]
MALLIIIGLGIVPACGDSREVPGKITVATDATLVPMSFMNDRNRIDGFDRDLMDAVARQAGIQVEFVNVEWAGLLGGLSTGKYDAAISSITILEERKKKMNFTRPYLKSGLAIVVRKDQTGVQTLEDLINRKLMVGAQRGTTAYFFLKDHPAIRNVGYESYGHAVQDLIKGELDAVVGESTGTLYYKNKDKPVFEKIKLVGEILTDEYYGIAVRRDKTALLEALNRALTTLLNNGTVQRLHEKWDLGRAAVIPSGETPPG